MAKGVYRILFVTSIHAQTAFTLHRLKCMTSRKLPKLPDLLLLFR